jgi:hypothetical protein
VNDIYLSWFCSYLTGRTQSINANDLLSVTCSVPK